MALWNSRSRNPTWLETSKSANFPFYRGEGFGKPAHWNLKSKNPTRLSKVALWNLKCKNATWLETSKSANFSFYRAGGGGKWHFQIWSPRIQLDLKLPNLPTFHFTGWGGGRSCTLKLKVQESHFKICQLFILRGGGGSGTYQSEIQSKNPTWLETFKSANFSFDRGEGEVGTCGKVALWNLKSKNPTWLDTSNSANFSFYRVGVGEVALWSLKCKNPIWLETSKSANFSFDRGEVWVGGCGKVALWNRKSKNPTWLETSKSANFSFYRVGVEGSSILKSEVQKSNLTWNFQICQLFILQGGGGGMWHFEIWRPRIKLLNLHTFYFKGGAVVFWNQESKNPTQLETSKSANFSFYNGGERYFEIWSPEIQLNLKLPNLPTFHFTWWGVGEVAIWNLKYRNPTWLETSNLITFHLTGRG